MEYSLIFAFSAGLLSTLHCVGMCGGIVGALTANLPDAVRRERRRVFALMLCYNLGRLLSYGIVGALVGAFGASLAEVASPRYGHLVLQWLAALTMLGVGLYLAGWFPKFALVESVGLPLWRKLQPISQRLLPVKSPGGALLLGVVWGWLPCGLVYAAAVYAVSAGGPLQGAIFMLVFGIGTLPAMMMVGLLSNKMLHFARLPQARRAAGLVIIVLALLTLTVGEDAMNHAGHLHSLHMH